MRLHIPCSGYTHMEMIYSMTFNHYIYINVYKNALYLLLLYIGPLLALAVMNALLVRAIHRSRRSCRSNTSQRYYSDLSATLVLIIIVLVFIICETPELVLRVLTLIDRHNGKEYLHTMTYKYWHVISEVLMVFNSAVNFFIYATFGRRFRFVMKETFKQLTSTNATLMTPESVPLQHGRATS